MTKDTSDLATELLELPHFQFSHPRVSSKSRSRGQISSSKRGCEHYKEAIGELIISCGDGAVDLEVAERPLGVRSREIGRPRASTTLSHTPQALQSRKRRLIECHGAPVRSRHKMPLMMLRYCGRPRAFNRQTPAKYATRPTSYRRGYFGRSLFSVLPGGRRRTLNSSASPST
jgi:hypothetical protein